MTTIWIGAAVAVLLGLIGYVLVRGRSLPPTKRGMKEFARNPSKMRQMEHAFAEREALLGRAKNLNDAEIAGGVQAILGSDRQQRATWGRALGEAGRRAWPPVLAALEDARAASEIERKGLLGQTPFESLVTILSRSGCDAVLPHLVPLLSSDHQKNRELAAMHILSLGTPGAVEPALLALRDPDKGVRSYACIGAGWAAKSPALSPEFREAICAHLDAVCAGETEFNTFEDMRAAKTLLELDPSGAPPRLSSARCLRIDNPHLQDVLHALNATHTRVPASLATSMYQHAMTQTGHPWPYVRAELLQALAATEPRSAEGLILRSLESEDDTERRGAADALLRLHALPGPYSLLEVEDLTTLPAPVRHVIAAIEFEAEVNNGGVSQYFFNSAGDHWPIALEGFRAMKCVGCADILDQATRILGKDGPSLNRSRRIKQYAKLSDQTEQVLDGLSSRFYKDEDGLQVRIAQYMVAHAGVFKKFASAMSSR